MKRFCVLAGAALLLLATGLTFTAGASAAEYEVEGLPEVGHCVKVPLGTGEYQGGNCLHIVHAGARYDWKPALESEKLAFSGSGGTTTLTVNGYPTHSVTCIDTNIFGHWTGRHTAKVQFELQGCTNSEGKQCQSEATKSEILTNEMPAVLGFLKNTTNPRTGKPLVEVGLDFKGPSEVNPTLISFECGSLLEETRIEGSMIGKLSPENGMTLKSNLILQLLKGKQEYTKFVGEPADTLVASFMEGLETKKATAMFGIARYSESGENTTGKVEIKGEAFE